MDRSFLKKLKRNFTWLFFGQSFASLCNLICLSIIIKSLGSEGHGVFVVLTSILFLLGDLTNFQTSNGVVHFLANINDNLHQKARIIQFGILLDILAGTIAMLLFLFFLAPLLSFSGLDFNNYGFLYYFIPSLFIRAFNNGTFTGVLRSYSKFKLIALTSIILSVFKLTGFLFLIAFGKADLINFIFVELIGEFLREFFSFLFSIKVLRAESVNIFELKGSFFKLEQIEREFCKFNFYNGVSLSADLVLGHLSNLIISRYLGGAPTSYLRVIQKVGSILVKFTSPLEQIFYPKMCELIAANKKEVALKVFKKYFGWSSTIGLLLIFILMGLYNVWAPHFINEPTSYALITAFYLFIFVFNCSVMPVHGIMLAMGLVKYNAVYTIVLNSAYLILLFLYVPDYGLGAFVALTFLQAFFFVCLKLFHIVGETRFFQGK